MEQDCQYVAEKLQYDKNSYTFASHFAQNFDQKNDPTTVLWNNQILNPFYGKTYQVDENLD